MRSTVDMKNTLAIIPARVGSKGIPNKNWRPLAGHNPAERAGAVAVEARFEKIVLTTDAFGPDLPDAEPWSQLHVLYAPAPLHTDECPMIDVVKDVLSRVPGPEDQIIVLLQPTQPLRKPEHVLKAIERLRTNEWDSVVGIKAIPRTHAPEFVLMYGEATLGVSQWGGHNWCARPARRQAVPQPYVLDGTVYAFYRRTVSIHGNIYGEYVSGLVIDPDETCSLDTPDDWVEAERRLREG